MTKRPKGKETKRQRDQKEKRPKEKETKRKRDQKTKGGLKRKSFFALFLFLFFYYDKRL